MTSLVCDRDAARETYFFTCRIKFPGARGRSATIEEAWTSRSLGMGTGYCGGWTLVDGDVAVDFQRDFEAGTLKRSF